MCMGCWTNCHSIAFQITAAPGVKIVPTAAGVVISQTAQVYQPHIIVQPAVQVTHVFVYYANSCVAPFLRCM